MGRHFIQMGPRSTRASFGPAGALLTGTGTSFNATSVLLGGTGFTGIGGATGASIASTSALLTSASSFGPRLIMIHRVAIVGNGQRATLSPVGEAVQTGNTIATIPTITFIFGTASSVDLRALYAPWMNLSIHVMQLATGSAALPAGVELQTDGQLVYDGGGIITTVANIKVAIELTGAADWANMSAGAHWALKFDTEAQMRGNENVSFENGSPVFYRNYCQHPNGLQATPTNRPPRIQWISGGNLGGQGGCMRIVHLASDGQTTGAWRHSFLPDTVTYANGTAASIPNNTSVHVAILSTLPASKWVLNGDGQYWKTWIFAGWGNSGWGNSCQFSEFTRQYIDQIDGALLHYVSCSDQACGNGGALAVPNFPQSGDWRYQTARDRGASFTNKFDRYCLLGGGGPTQGCWRDADRANIPVWYYYIFTPRNNRQQLDADVFVCQQGDTAWTPIETWRNITNPCWGPTNPEPFWCMHITSYTTPRTGPSNVDTYMDILRIISSPTAIPPPTVWTS